MVDEGICAARIMNGVVVGAAVTVDGKFRVTWKRLGRAPPSPKFDLNCSMLNAIYYLLFLSIYIKLHQQFH
jgi:hypothetical protein